MVCSGVFTQCLCRWPLLTSPPSPHPPTQAAVSAHARLVGPDSVEAGVACQQLGLNLLFMGRWPECIPQYERARANIQAKRGPGADGGPHPATARTVNNLSWVLKAMGRYGEALPLHELAVRLADASAEPDAAELRPMLRQNMAAMMRDLGRYDEALKLYEQALAEIEVVKGGNHPFTAIVVTGLGTLKALLRDRAGALAAYSRARAIREAAYGPKHTDVSRSLNNLGVLMGGDEGLSLCENALRLRISVCPPDHPEAARIEHSIATIHHRAGKAAEALSWYERALATREASPALGPHHPDTAETGVCLARLLEETAAVSSGVGLAFKRTPAALLDQAQAAMLAHASLFGADHPALQRGALPPSSIDLFKLQ